MEVAEVVVVDYYLYLILLFFDCGEQHLCNEYCPIHIIVYLYWIGIYGDLNRLKAVVEEKNLENVWINEFKNQQKKCFLTWFCLLISINIHWKIFNLFISVNHFIINKFDIYIIKQNYGCFNE